MQESAETSLTRYLVELHAPDDGWVELEWAASRARVASGVLRDEGRRVRLLRTIYVPEDGSCFFLFEGESPEIVAEAARRANLVTTGIEATIALPPPPDGINEGGPHA